MKEQRLSRRNFLATGARIGMTGLSLSASSLLLQGFDFSDLGSTLQQATKIADSATKSFNAVSKALEDITPEQEYYIGRTIGAIVLSKYKPYEQKAGNSYLNLLGQTLARFSDLPELFDGYHFQILDSTEINAFATPSGLVFVTRGMLHCCAHEDALAAVLAHEIGHVQLKHGLQSIEKDRITKATSILAIEGTKNFAQSDIANLTSTFEDSINDITSTMINNGYSRSFENEADAAAVSLLKRVGYDPAGLIDMLQIMNKQLKPGGLDFAKTHPSPESRIESLEKLVSGAGAQVHQVAQQRRFQTALQGV
ncbi:MAG: M48 family metallopeptidase [Proteobacteria bacterium]|nr:M48 family metallopeptidase [Pseudomonadota bacterium]MBU1649699.1 M48 family metallopeptidase [Pseudomonadota bacterium]